LFLFVSFEIKAHASKPILLLLNLKCVSLCLLVVVKSVHASNKGAQKMASSLLAALNALKAWKQDNATLLGANAQRLEAIAAAVCGSSDSGNVDRQGGPDDHAGHASRDGMDTLVCRVEACQKRLVTLEAATTPLNNGQLLVADPSPCAAAPHGSAERTASATCGPAQMSQDLRTLLLGAVRGDVIVLRGGEYCCAPRVTASGVTLVSSSLHAVKVGIRPAPHGDDDHHVGAGSPGVPSVICGCAPSSCSPTSAAPSLTITDTARGVTVYGCTITANPKNTGGGSSPPPGEHTMTIPSTSTALSLHMPIVTRSVDDWEGLSIACASAARRVHDDHYLFEGCHIIAGNGIAVNVQLSTPALPSSLEDDSSTSAITSTRVITFRGCEMRARRGPIVRIRAAISHNGSTTTTNTSCNTTPNIDCHPLAAAEWDQHASGRMVDSIAEQLSGDQPTSVKFPLIRFVFDACQLLLEDGPTAVVVEGDVDRVEVMFTNGTSVTAAAVQQRSSTQEDASARRGAMHVVLLRPNTRSASRLFDASSRDISRASIVAFESSADDNASSMTGFEVSMVAVEVPRGVVSLSTAVARRKKNASASDGLDAFIASGACRAHDSAATPLPMVEYFV
jgi:hypothetical protein